MHCHCVYVHTPSIISVFGDCERCDKSLSCHDVCPPGSGSVRSPKDLTLKVGVSSIPPIRVMCTISPTVEVKLSFINDTAPSCGQVELSTLCFPEKISNPHITENRMPGALRQLRRFTHMSICPNYTISYGVVAGTD